ncbi:MAG: sigma-70 family RNA polymerase sigma factor [Vulcanimicrobiota bacterium]
MADEAEEDSSDEAALFLSYREEGGLFVRDQIFSRYQHIVDIVTRKFPRAGEREELLQVGYIGLLNAIERFDSERGFKFSTYASHCVEGEIRHFLRDKSETIRRPRWIRALSSQVAAFLERFLQEHERLPTLTEISEALNIEESGVQAILRAKQPASLDEAEGGGSGVPKGTIRSARLKSFQLPLEDRISISQAFERLLEIEQKVVYLFFVQDFTQKEIASRLALSPRKVSRLMRKALDSLRGQLQSEDKNS